MAVRKVTISVEGDGPAGQEAVLRLLAAIAAGLEAEKRQTIPIPVPAPGAAS